MKSEQSAYPSGKFLFRVIVYFLFILAVITLLDRIIWADIVDDILEGLLCLAVAFFVASRKPFQRFFLNLPRPHKIILLVFFSFMVIGQLIDLPRRTFPFISWTMYGRAQGANEVYSYSYRGITQQGEVVSVNPVVLFPTLSHGRMALALEKRIDNLLHAKEVNVDSRMTQRPGGVKGIVFDFRMGMLPKPAGDLRRQEKELTEFLITIGRMYNQKFPHSPLEAIEVIQTKRDIADFFKDPQVKKVYHAALERER